MASATASSALSVFVTDPHQLKAITQRRRNCLTMCDARARCVGVSAIPTSDPGSVTGMIGVHGDVSGFITVNLAREGRPGGRRRAVAGPASTSLDHQVIDGVGEITNIIAGGIKNGLAGTPWGFSHVTVPSVIVGRNYQIAYAKGLQYLCRHLRVRERQFLPAGRAADARGDLADPPLRGALRLNPRPAASAARRG